MLQLTVMMEEQQQENQTEEPDSLGPKENSEEPKGEITVPRIVQIQSLSSLLPKAPSAVLHPTTRADPQPGKDPSSRTPAHVEQLRTELRDLRDQFNQMKTQHK